jgi:CRP-like cAMP-binding protein
MRKSARLLAKPMTDDIGQLTIPSYGEPFRYEEILAGLPPTELQVIDQIKQSRRFAPGEVLFAHGSIASGLYMLEKGKVSILRPTGSGGESVLRFAIPGEILGLTEALAGRPAWYTAVAATGSITSFIETEDLVRTLREAPTIRQRLLALLACRIKDRDCIQNHTQ